MSLRQRLKDVSIRAGILGHPVALGALINALVKSKPTNHGSTIKSPGLPGVICPEKSLEIEISPVRV
jgi:hypothetical protein